MPKNHHPSLLLGNVALPHGDFLHRAAELSNLILNENTFGTIKWNQKHLDLPDYGLDFENLCFFKCAQSHGASNHSREHAIKELAFTL